MSSSIVEDTFERKVPKATWFVAHVKRAIAREGSKLTAFVQGMFVWARRDGDAWSVVNRDKGTRLILATSAAKRHLELVFVPKPLPPGSDGRLSVATGDDNPVITEDELNEDLILVKPAQSGWFQAKLLSHIMRDGQRLADFHKRMTVSVRKEGKYWHVVSPRGPGVRLTQRAYDRYVDPIYVPKMANPIEAQQLDGIVGRTRTQPAARVEGNAEFESELRAFLEASHA